MTRKLYAIVAVVGVAGLYATLSSSSSKQSETNFLQLDPLDSVFARYLAEHGKSYATKEEYERRKAVFAKQLKFVTDHNS